VKNTFIELQLDDTTKLARMTRSKSCPGLLQAYTSQQRPHRQSEAFMEKHSSEGREDKPEVPQEQALLAALTADTVVAEPLCSPMIESRCWSPDALWPHVHNQFEGANGLEAPMAGGCARTMSMPLAPEPARDQVSLLGSNQAPRTPLDFNARMWRPVGNVFSSEVYKTVESLGAMLQQTFEVPTEVQFCHLPCGTGKCTLVATMRPDHLNSFRSAVLQAAEAGLFERTNRTRGVCLLGCKGTPFKQLSSGFSASLANVPSKRSMCRQMYNNGHCSRGSTCDKEHPSSEVGFEFTLLGGLPLERESQAL